MAAEIALKWRLLMAATALLVLPVMCLERTTGIARSLDARFTVGEPEGAKTIKHDPDAGKVEPFADLKDDDAVLVRGILVSEREEAIDLDLLTADPTAEAGYVAQGKVQMEGPQEFSVRVPKELGELKLLAFQDLDGDGPSDDDPFAYLTVEIGDEDVNGLILALVVGAYTDFNLSGASSRTAFPDHEGEWTLVSGTLTSPLEQAIAVDFLAPDAGDEGGLAFLTKTQLEGPGPYEIALPQALGPVTLQFFQDAAGDGPDETDPFAQAELQIQTQPRISMDLALLPGGYIEAAETENPGQPGEQPVDPVQVIFEDLGDAPVTLSGELVLEGAQADQVAVDVYRVDGAGHGGRSLLKKIYLSPGSFSFQVPSGFGQLILEASIDADGDGPTPGDPQGACEQNPVTVGDQDVEGLRITVKG